MKYYVIDAFTDTAFKGNPAGVCLLEQPLDDALMQSIAAENNLAETAFILRTDDGYDLRWFTPTVEIDLCGHATLASAFVIRNFVNINVDHIDFFTKSGILSVDYRDGLYEMDFPSRPPKQIEKLPIFESGIGCKVLEAYLARDLLLVVKDESAINSIQPYFETLQNFDAGFGVIVTARGDEVDFVSRFFAPKNGIPEDPVTGSSHSTLIPFWADRLGKMKMIARQLSRRGGTLYCQNCGERVRIAGYTAMYLTGEINLGE
jgi:predicted PhzF superfamily epimerase YddE/YHI9